VLTVETSVWDQTIFWSDPGSQILDLCTCEWTFLQRLTTYLLIFLVPSFGFYSSRQTCITVEKVPPPTVTGDGGFTSLLGVFNGVVFNFPATPRQNSRDMPMCKQACVNPCHSLRSQRLYESEGTSTSSPLE
jgi:hypothetical protein